MYINGVFSEDIYEESPYVENENEVTDPDIDSMGGSCKPLDCTFRFHKTPWIGGTRGDPFDDTRKLSQSERLQKIVIRTQKRVDRIEFHTDRQSLVHGGTGGHPKSLSLGPNEKIRSLDTCEGWYEHSYRVFYVKFTTTHGRVLSGGMWTGNYVHINIHESQFVLGMYGRSKREIDRIGFIYKMCS